MKSETAAGLNEGEKEKSKGFGREKEPFKVDRHPPPERRCQRGRGAPN